MNLWQKIINLGTSHTEDLAKQRVIRLINTFALVALISDVICEIYVLIFVNFFISVVLLAAFTFIVSFSVFYFNSKGNLQAAIWLLIGFLNVSIVNSIFLMDAALGVSSMFFCVFVLYVAVLDDKNKVLSLSMISLFLILLAIHLHHNKLIEPLLYFSPSQELPIKYVFTINSAVLVLLLSFFLKTNMNRYKETVEIANLKLNGMLNQINIQKEELQQSLEEKEVLLKEVHHRIKNNFQTIISLLYLQADAVKDSHAKASLMEATSRINSMALIHQKLYQSKSLKHINLSSYFQQILEYAQANYFLKQNNVTCTLECGFLELNIEQAVPLGLIFNEIVTNFHKHVAVIHTNPVLFMSVRKAGNLLSFIAKDNGKGLPQAVLHKAPNDSLGLLLVEMLVNQLRGTLKKRNENGLVTEIQFKLE